MSGSRPAYLRARVELRPGESSSPSAAGHVAGPPAPEDATPAQFASAIAAVRSGATLAEAAAANGVSRDALRGRLRRAAASRPAAAGQGDRVAPLVPEGALMHRAGPGDAALGLEVARLSAQLADVRAEIAELAESVAATGHLAVRVAEFAARAGRSGGP